MIAVRPGRSVTEAEIAGFLREHLAGYKVPKLIALVGPDALPVNPSGKIVKTNIRKAMDGGREAAADPTNVRLFLYRRPVRTRADNPRRHM